MGRDAIILTGTIGYMIALAFVSFTARKNARTAKSFASGGVHYPGVLIGFVLMSEFIGTAASVGTAEAGYKVGISAAWNVAALGIGFVFYSLFLARKFKDTGENTISGVLARTYGQPVKVATSIIMIFALQIVAISTYTSGGAIISPLFGIDRSAAIVATGLAGVLYVGLGGMSSVIYTNVIHAMVKYLGIVIALAIGLSQVGGVGTLRTRLPAAMFDATAVGWPQICAWLATSI